MISDGKLIEICMRDVRRAAASCKWKPEEIPAGFRIASDGKRWALMEMYRNREYDILTSYSKTDLKEKIVLEILDMNKVHSLEELELLFESEGI